MHKGDQRKTASKIFMHLMQATKVQRVMAELNVMPQKHWQSIRSGPRRIQDCASNAVDTTFKIHAQNIQIKLATNLSKHHWQDKSMKTVITNNDYTSIKVIITCSL